MSAIDVASQGVAPVPLPAAAACDHCGLPVPAGLASGEPTEFCCSGCRTAYAVLHESGLDRYYTLPERRGRPVEPSGRSYEEFDHASFRALYVRPRPGGLAEIDLVLEGVHCPSCVWLVERLPLALAGVASAELDVTRARTRVVWDAARVSLSAVARWLDRIGYRPHPCRGAGVEALRLAEDRAMLAGIGVAGAIAVNTMLAALAIYSGWFGGMEREFERYFRWVSLAITTPAILGPGRVFFRGAWSSFRARALHMDVPIALALAAGFSRGAWNTLTDRGPIYFDGVALLVFLLLVGRFLQQRAQRAARGSAELLYSLSPVTARVVEGGAVRDMPSEALLPGMMLEVRAGDSLAADGVVVEGHSELDLSLLTGESRSVAVGPGSQVFAGTTNRDATLRVRVDRSGESSRLGRLLLETERAASRRAPVARLADRMAGRFVAAVLLLAAATALYWMRRDPAAALDNAIALLIVTCPCALALATPLSITAAIGRAARLGLLVKGGDALERLAGPSVIVLDKTGTVTEGRSRLVAWEGPAWVRPLVLALERHSRHPIAAGFAAAWPEVSPAVARDVTQVPGAGLEGMVGGRRIAIGTPAYVRSRLHGAEGAPSCDPSLTSAWTAVEAPSYDSALTPAWIAVDGRLAARAGFGDALRSDAREVVTALRERGHRVRLLSGDDPAVVTRVGRELGLDAEACRGGVSPEAKLQTIESLAAREPVIMVGDGVNDAAAIARATVGIGVSGGAEASLDAADVYLARGGLEGLVILVDGARRTLAVIRRNIAFSILYNAVGVGLAVTGVINPLIAAVLMPLSSLTVVMVAWRSRTFEVGQSHGASPGPRDRRERPASDGVEP